MSQAIGYIRVSSEGQNTSRQLDGLKLDRVFEDKVSAKDTNRPALKEMIAYAREGDTVNVHSLDRLARNLEDLRGIVRGLLEKGVTVVFHKEGLTFSHGDTSPMGLLLLNVMGAFAEFERSLIKERQKEGIEQAKKRGAYTGRKPSLNSEQVEELRKLAALGVAKSKLARQFKISRESVYNYLEA